jgi:hypothetical protein
MAYWLSNKSPVDRGCLYPVRASFGKRFPGHIAMSGPLTVRSVQEALQIVGGILDGGAIDARLWRVG